MNELAAQLCLGAKLIYWHHNTNQLTYLLGGDKEMWAREWNYLKDMVTSGRITSIRTADPIVVEATGLRFMRKTLYPMLVVFRGLHNEVVQCQAYFMIEQSGNIEHMDSTPYFYTSKSARDCAIDRLSSLMPEHHTN